MSGHNSTEITKNRDHRDNLAHNGSQASSRKPGILKGVINVVQGLIYSGCCNANFSLNPVPHDTEPSD